MRRVLITVLLVCLVTASLTSCLARRRLFVRKGVGNPQQQLLTADRQSLIDSIARQYDAVQDFSAEVDMVPALGTAEKSKITEYKDVRAYILFRKPSDIRLIGLYPVVRNKAFDMVSNGLDFKLYMPSRESLHGGQERDRAALGEQTGEPAPAAFSGRYDGAAHRPTKEKVLLDESDRRGQCRSISSPWFMRTAAGSCS